MKKRTISEPRLKGVAEEKQGLKEINKPKLLVGEGQEGLVEKKKGGGGGSQKHRKKKREKNVETFRKQKVKKKEQRGEKRTRVKATKPPTKKRERGKRSKIEGLKKGEGQNPLGKASGPRKTSGGEKRSGFQENPPFNNKISRNPKVETEMACLRCMKKEVQESGANQKDSSMKEPEGESTRKNPGNPPKNLEKTHEGGLKNRGAAPQT